MRGPSPCCCLRYPPSLVTKRHLSIVQTLRAVLAANLFLLLPLTAATYHLPLPLTARPSVDCRDRYPTPNSNFTGTHLLVPSTALWLSMVLSTIWPLTGAVAPSQPPRLRFRSFCTRLSCRERRLMFYPFTHLWVFTLLYPISARLPSDLLKIRDNSSSLPQLGRDTYSTVVSGVTFQKYQGSLYPIVVSEATFQKIPRIAISTD